MGTGQGEADPVCDSNLSEKPLREIKKIDLPLLERREGMQGEN